MVFKWLRENLYASFGLLVLRLYLGYDWLTAGWGKITGEKPFSAAGLINRAIENPVTSHDAVVYPTYTAFLKGFALPNVGLFSFLVEYGEFLVGLGLILGCLTQAAMFFGVFMNFMFMFAGTVSSNPWMALLGFIVLVGGANSGRIGLDRWVLPYIRQYYNKTFKKNNPVSA
ncbi:DoxX family protein [Tepidibacillus infernus]|uniref:Crp/Fnr family transcriptional regulator n=1 Tax=Tepidibacillus decaturensis TaxID=1413211 RepID=A0A135L1Z0_9BACI|nr:MULTISPECIES: DoxX family protein [Tepidibacillus]KXG43034.1 Crp/Fnr family transcriptional regulator [Tepidibacillus decaturensis]GBF10831.1 doxX protein [Tepidibacillus sp. HK-1]